VVGINDFKLEPVDVGSILTRERYVESFAAAFEIAINFPAPLVPLQQVTSLDVA
jgi:hypothetical protein